MKNLHFLNPSFFIFSILVWNHFPAFRISHDFLFVSWSWSPTRTEWLQAVKTMQQSRRRLASIQLSCLLNTGLIMHTSNRWMEMKKEKQSKLDQKQGDVAVTVLCWASLESLGVWAEQSTHGHMTLILSVRVPASCKSNSRLTCCSWKENVQT